MRKGYKNPGRGFILAGFILSLPRPDPWGSKHAQPCYFSILAVASWCLSTGLSNEQIVQCSVTVFQMAVSILLPKCRRQQLG